MEFLPVSFVEQYVDENPKPLNELGEFVYYRTYSRWLEGKGRREYWYETIKRTIEFSMAQEYSHVKKLGFKPDLKKLREEAKELFVNIYNLKQAPSGRSLWIANANESVNDKFIMGQFNCSFIQIEQWKDLGDVFYALLVGTGVGIRATKKTARKMPKIRTNTTLEHSEYKPVSPEQRLEDTELKLLDNGYAKIYVGDSKEGWVQALELYLLLLTEQEYEHIHTVKISYNSIRPQGERLKTFGGTASGPQPLREMFEGFDNVLKNKIEDHLEPIETDEKGYGQIRPVHILDMANLIGNNVVVGKQLLCSH